MVKIVVLRSYPPLGLWRIKNEKKNNEKYGSNKGKHSGQVPHRNFQSLAPIAASISVMLHWFNSHPSPLRMLYQGILCSSQPERLICSIHNCKGRSSFDYKTGWQLKDRSKSQTGSKTLKSREKNERGLVLRLPCSPENLFSILLVKLSLFFQLIMLRDKPSKLCMNAWSLMQ